MSTLLAWHFCADNDGKPDMDRLGLLQAGIKRLETSEKE